MFSPANPDWSIRCIGDQFAPAIIDDAAHLTETTVDGSYDCYTTAGPHAQPNNGCTSESMSSPYTHYYSPSLAPSDTTASMEYACGGGRIVRAPSACASLSSRTHEPVAVINQPYRTPGYPALIGETCSRDMKDVSCWPTAMYQQPGYHCSFMDYSMSSAVSLGQSSASIEAMQTAAVPIAGMTTAHESFGTLPPGTQAGQPFVFNTPDQYANLPFANIPSSSWPGSQFTRGQLPDNVSITPRTVSLDVTSNYNHHPGMTFSAPDMSGWLRRASNTGDRVMPRLDTSHLAPPTTHSNATRSPTSASTAGSSTSRSARRPKWQLSSGAHPFTCAYPSCGAGFYNQAGLTHHNRSHKPYTARRHECTICHARFQYRKDLSRHMPRHDPNARRYYCQVIGCKFATKGFGRQDHLDRHVATVHTTIQPGPSRLAQEAGGSSNLNHSL